MAFASFDKQRGAAPLAEINMVPLIDVMLVLLVIFIVTAPLLTHAVKLELPRADTATNTLLPQTIEFAIDAAGQRYWNGERIDRAEAARRFSQAGATDPRTEVQLRADGDSAYRSVAETLADASRAGLTRIGFVSQPDSR
ncbi:biopolymer transporter ExbD [Ideonella sp. 4Y16]|uniref:Biopolymer transporter ExbD n=1 Tax=Ideonella alba TaxID=2824118 RepID=A0A940YBS6_9BURK|nr:biopolymer transporter ExbD [Ideonella alba]MBQ0929450.1 biopolymer transporter ExbD [Ideonella alba]MBQ0944552.1 biopolymer transporter ExbD [Ideonella alba]